MLARYKLRRIDGVNILHGDVKLTAPVNEVTDKPAVGHIITAPDSITGELQRYEIITASADSAGAAYPFNCGGCDMAKGWNIDPAAFAGLVAEDVKLRQRTIAIQLLNEIVQRSPVGNPELGHQRDRGSIQQSCWGMERISLCRSC